MPKLPPKKNEAETETPAQVEGTHPGPSIRLATLGPPEALAKGLGPTVRLAQTQHAGGFNGNMSSVKHLKTENEPEESALPALLVSYVYLEPFLKNRTRYRYRDWVMDSGAFSAHNSGTEVCLQDYIDCCKELLTSDPKLTEVFALDVIGDHVASLRNTEEMWRQGVSAIPCFHYGEPWDFLKGMAKDYPKIALGGLVGQPAKSRDAWIAQCFARIWPKKIHGFGLSGEKTIMRFPFHSVDATNWEIGPCRFGRWASFGGHLSVRGSEQNLRSEVEWYLELEKRAQRRWQKEMAKLVGLDDHLCPTIRPDGSSKNTSGRRIGEALGKDPKVRLAYSTGGGGKVSNIAFNEPGAPLEVKKWKEVSKKKGKKDV